MPANAESSPWLEEMAMLLLHALTTVLPKLTPTTPASNLPSALDPLTPLMEPAVRTFWMLAPSTHLKGAAKRVWFEAVRVIVLPWPSKVPEKALRSSSLT